MNIEGSPIIAWATNELNHTFGEWPTFRLAAFSNPHLDERRHDGFVRAAQFAEEVERLDWMRLS